MPLVRDWCRSHVPTKLLASKIFFTAWLHMPPHPVHVDTLHKFLVQLHQLAPNAIVQIGKFIWAVTSCGGRQLLMCLLNTMSCTINTRIFILKDARLPSLCNLAVLPSILVAMEEGRDLPPLRGTNG
jgi:hypothetical protein